MSIRRFNNITISTQKFSANAATSVGPLDGTSAARAGLSANSIYALGSTTSGVYWLKPSGYSTPFQTYCLMNVNGGGWMLMFKSRDVANTSSFLSYDHVYWGTLAPNATASNLLPSETLTDVATDIVNSYPFKESMITEYGSTSAYSTYLYGSANDGTARLFTSQASTNGIKYSTQVGASIVWGNGTLSGSSAGGSGSGFWTDNLNGQTACYNSSQSHTGTSYARWGIAYATEFYAGTQYSTSAYGIGLKTSKNGLTKTASSFGVNARNDAGGGNATATVTDNRKIEVWVR